MRSTAYAAWAALLGAAGAVASFRLNNEADLYFHLDLGRAVLRHGARTVPEPTAFADFDPTCVVPVWLWDVAMYGLYQLGGFTAVGVATVLTACASAVMIALLCRRALPAEDFAAFALVATAAVTCVVPRYQVRPQTFAAFVLPLFLWLVLGYARSSGRARMRLGVAIAALAVLWAQVHNSFVLAPAIFVAGALPSVLAGAREQRRVDGLVLIGCLLALLTSAHGLDIVHYTLSHAGGDTVRHISEMMAPKLTDYPDLASHEGRAYLALSVLALAGIVRAGRLRYAELALALLGAVLFTRAVRFAQESAILLLPLASIGACNVLAALRAQPWAKLARPCVALAVLALALQLASRAEAGAGVGERPLGLGVDADSVPKLASAYLARLPQGSRVLTAHGAGSYLGFLADGRIRTYVDGRTPMYFHDADFAVAREALTDSTALELVFSRFDVRAMVIERDHPGCDVAAKLWVPAVIEGKYSTFVPPGTAEPLRGVDPCGPAPLRRGDCAAGREALDTTIARLERLGDAPMIHFLRAARELTCGGGDAALALRELHAAGPMTHTPPLTRLWVRALLRQGRVDEAHARLIEALERGDVSVLSVLATPEAASLSSEQLHDVLRLATYELDDAASPGLHAQLAMLCVPRGDVECVRFHALRAAARGEARVLPALYFLGQTHPSERVRADANAWGQLLAERARQAREAAPAAAP